MLQNPSDCRGGTPCTPSNFNEAIYCLVFHGPLSTEELSGRIGVPRKRLLNAANPNRQESVFAASWIEPIVEHTGDLSLLRYLAAKLNCAIVPLPTALGANDQGGQRVLDITRELGEAVTKYQRARADGRVDDVERDGIRSEIREAVVELLRWDADVVAESRSLAHPAPGTSPAPTSPSVHTNGRDLVIPGCQPATRVDAKPAPARMNLSVSAPARKGARA